MKFRFSKFLMIIFVAFLAFSSPASEAKGRGKATSKKIHKVIKNKSINIISKTIATGHAFKKHGNEFNNATKKKLKKVVSDTMKYGEKKRLQRNRVAYWNDRENAIVIHDPNHRTNNRLSWKQKNDKKGKSKIKNKRRSDLGTVFKPIDGKPYFDRQR